MQIGASGSGLVALLGGPSEGELRTAGPGAGGSPSAPSAEFTGLLAALLGAGAPVVPVARALAPRVPTEADAGEPSVLESDAAAAADAGEAADGAEAPPTGAPVAASTPTSTEAAVAAPVTGPATAPMDALHYGLRTDPTSAPLPTSGGEPAPRATAAAPRHGAPGAAGGADARHGGLVLDGDDWTLVPHPGAAGSPSAPAAPTARVAIDVGRAARLDARLDARLEAPADARLDALVDEALRGARPSDAERLAAPDVAALGASALAFASTAGSTVPVAATPAANTTTVASSVARPSRETSALAPELRTRLERVVGRMRRELGREVRVVEGPRSQERQEWLYAQGRTRPGPVVTWTRSSQHTLGRAVDVQIDGGWDDTAAFRQLQRIAAEEGLHTLGMRDPGHLELPRGPGGATLAHAAPSAPTAHAPHTPHESHASDATPGQHAPAVLEQAAAPSARPAAPSPAGRPLPATAVPPVAAVAPVASVASVAHVATVAQVSGVAGVAVPAQPGAVPSAPAPARPARGVRTEGSGRSGADAELAQVEAEGSSDRVAAPSPRADTAAERPDASRGASRLGAAVAAHAAHVARGRSAAARRDHGAPDDAARAGSAATPALPTHLAAGEAVADASQPAAPMLGAAAVDRVATINDVRDAGAGRHVSHLTLRVDNAQGGEDLIRIDMRGLAVDAQIDLGDLRDVDRMSGRVGELREALERHGLSSDTVRISSAGRAAEAAAADGHRTALAAAAVGGASAGSDAGGAGSQQSASQRDAQRDSQRDQQQPGGRDAASAHTGRDGQQQQGRRDDRQGRGAEPWLAEDDVLARARRASTTQPPR